jgi:uncharacterized protein (DUF1684 family)
MEVRTRRLCAFLLTVIAAAAAIGYQASLEAWRKEREERLKAPDGWLAVAGLFWLKEGENRVGSDPSYEIVLPQGRAPLRLGIFDFQNGKTQFRMASGAHVTVNGKPVMTADLKPDADRLQSGDFTMFVIKRGSRYAIRMRDLHSKMREEFTGLRWYPPKEQYRVVAKFVAYDQPQKIAISNVLGQTDYQPSPGYALFQLMGHSYRLDPVMEGDQLFFIFRDQTAARTTYGAGRFLYADPAKEGKVILDFNKAISPPCAFTPFATCPLPPKQNRLTVKIEAGEMVTAPGREH